jgi:iron complex transport system ATP-binding protein
MAAPLLDFRRVTVMRGDRAVLQDIDLRIGAGERVAILGPNGSGKSSLIRTITREFYPLPRPGSSLTLLGRDRWNVFELRRRLGIVTPDLPPGAPEALTGFELVASIFLDSVGLWPGHQTVTPAMRASALQALARLEAGHLTERPVGEMSSGELRRVQIARAVAHRPAALLLDEPSANLDLASQRELREILRGLTTAGTGLVLVTHHLGDIIPEVDRVVFLQLGRIAGDGPKETMLTPDRLEALFQLPVQLARRDGYYHAW